MLAHALGFLEHIPDSRKCPWLRLELIEGDAEALVDKVAASPE
jgi:hypothetical protein